MVPPAPPTYERGAVTAADLSQIDQPRLEQFLALRAPALCEQLEPLQLAALFGLLAQSGSRLCPTVAGLLLFGRLPQLFRPEWGLSAVRVEGSTLDAPLAQREDIWGDLPTLLEGGMSFVRQHSSSLSPLPGAGEPAPEYPETAVREALLNALVHRDYRLSGRVSLRLFQDRLELWSPGGMPGQLDAEELCRRGGVSFPRNALVASVLRAQGLMDQLGRGLTLIRAAMAEAGAPTPRIRSTNADVTVILPSRLVAPKTATPGN